MKKNLRKTPQAIIDKIAAMSGNDIYVGCAKKFMAADLRKGALNHLSVELTDKGLVFPASTLPPRSQGTFSTRNIDGEVIVRKDLPKETHYNTVTTPNWGDSSYGTHDVYLPYEKYPREFRPPRELEITMSSPVVAPGQASYLIAFRVNEVLNKKSKTFKEKLFSNLNLLQENVGACGVEAADVSLDEYTKTLQVFWEILPPGSREEALARLFWGKTPSPELKNVAEQRYDFFQSLQPKRIIVGASGFRRYFGALLEENLVVFENIQYGNAVYVIYDKWEELSGRSRLELLSRKFGDTFERVIHTQGWKGQVRKIVASLREKGKGGTKNG